MKTTFWSTAPIYLLLVMIAGCTGSGGSGDTGPTEATISGTVTGLAPGATVVLQNNAGDDLAITTNGNFTFPAPVDIGADYDVSVLNQPVNPHQTCVVSVGSGSANQNITSVLVSCTTNTYTIGGSVADLQGSGLVLQNNGGDDFAVTANGEILFANTVESGGGYEVTVGTQPADPSQTCEVTNGSGSVIDQDITSVSVNCTTNTYAVGGTVTGLIGSGLVLQNNGGDDLSVATNGDFKFSANITSGDGYSVTVQAQPGSPSQDCLVVSGSGTVTDHEISSVNISCSTYQVGVTVTGLVSGETLTLQNNGGDDLLITGNGGPFVFNTLIHDFLPYDVTVSSQPVTSTQQCMVVNGAGTIPSTDVLDIVIVCPNVEALYPDNGANWNDYVNNNGGNGFAADDTPCNGVGNSYNDCLHGGEMRAVVLEGVSSCANVSADDDLDALNWHCDDSTGTARVISTSLTSTAALSSLIDFSSTQWKENAVNIYQFGVPVAKTPTGKWWTNSLSVANAGGSLDSESVIYLVTANPASDYTIDANKVGLVIQPGLSISGDGSDDVVYAKGPAYLWIEGAIDAGGNANGVFWENVTSSVMKDVHVRDSAFANNITLFNSSNNALKSIRVSGAISHGLYLENSHYNTVVDVLAADNQNAGIYITGSNNNRFLGSTTVNNDNGGNADGSGILMSGSTDNTFVNVTVANNKLSGLTLNMSGNNVMQNVVATNNYTSLLLLDNASNNTAANIVAVNNSRRGMLLRDVNNNYFTGLLKVGNNASSDCAVQGTNIAPGLVDISCSDSGANGSITYTGQQSDALLKTGVSIANSVVGKVVIDDNANQSDLNGGAMYTGITDWWSFENKFRVWALDGDPFPSLTHKGPLPLCENYVAFDETDCLSNGGTWRPDARIWDWSLAQDDDGDNGDAVLMGVLYLPQGDNVITHEWSNATSSTFLRNAVEVIGDGVGNDDGLCNSNETCLHTSNIGAYQGHGKLVPAGTFVDSGSGGVTGVRLLQYEINGY